MHLALSALNEAVGDYFVSQVLLRKEEFPDVIQTTWEELDEQGLLEQIHYENCFILTGRGWLASVLAIDAHRTTNFRQRLAALFSTLKSYVRPSREAKVVLLSQILDKSGLPEGWVSNIIESKYLEEMNGRKGAAWLKYRTLVLIPGGFNSDPVDLQTLISTEILQELEAAKEKLSELLCPHCGSDRIAIGSYPIDEHSDGDYETYSCGLSIVDGVVRELCPKDPNFPKLDDFAFLITERNGEYFCYPSGKSDYAKKVSLRGESGKTAEQAKARVIAHYEYRIGKRKHWEDVI